MLFFGGFSFVVELFVVLPLTVLAAWYLYFQYCVTYWRSKNVPTLRPCFPSGNLGASMLGTENMFVRLEKFYHRFKSAGHKHAGIYFFNGPIYFPIDPALIKRILTTDFDYFADRGIHYDEQFPLSVSLLGMPATKWKELRAKLTPTFTSGKLKTMFQSTFMKYTENLIEVLKPIATNRGEISAKKYLSLFTVDIIASSALGLDFNVLSNPDQDVVRIIWNMGHRPLRIKLKTILTEGLSNPGRLFKSVHDNTELKEWLESTIKQTMKYRKEHGITRNDFFNSLVEVEGITWNEIVAQISLFIFAGYDTSSNTMSNCLHELAYNPAVQDKLREEIRHNLGNNFKQYTYDGITRLTYLDYVIKGIEKETLRMYPITGILSRVCIKDYKVPGTDVVLNKGTVVAVPLLGLQRDPEYYPEPLTFNPERFADGYVPYTYMPFGEGPRNCIGIRYGLLQTKLGVAAIVSNFRIMPSEKSPQVLNFEKLPATPALNLETELYVRLELL